MVGWETQFAAIGVDAERVDSVSPSLWRLTMRAEELGKLLRMEESARLRTAALIFSAKEAFYKCQYALTHRWLGFEDVAVTIAGDAFEVSVVEPTHPLHYMLSPWIGRFRVDDQFVVAGIAAERHRPCGARPGVEAATWSLEAAPGLG